MLPIRKVADKYAKRISPSAILTLSKITGWTWTELGSMTVDELEYWLKHAIEFQESINPK